tara:strand:+ start:294 stop:656 length:363 start_codon:yes stop_codon:yes gene_type:complete
MPNLTLTFSNPLNASIQIGDIAYYTLAPSTVGGFQTSTQAEIVEIGAVNSINNNTNTIICTTTLLNNGQPTTSSYIFFSKNNKVNLSTVLGYYGELKFKNDSTAKSELFSVGSDMFISSK